MIISPISGKNFRSVLSSLVFHDSEFTEFNFSNNRLNSVIDYYNFEDTDKNKNAPWYRLKLTVGYVYSFEMYIPDKDSLPFSIVSVEYDIHFNQNKTSNLEQYAFTIQSELDSSENYLSALFYTHNTKDILYGFNGYIKILGTDCTISILKEMARD